MITAISAARYLERYMRAYRELYDLLTTPPPEGGGYPKIDISPYLSSPRLQCLLAEDGGVIADTSSPPNNEWHIAGGPTLMVDTPVTLVPDWVRDRLRTQGLLGKNIGIYRIVSKENLAAETWTGILPQVLDRFELSIGATELLVERIDGDLGTLVERLTFGAFGPILDLHFPSDETDFWNPHIVRGLGFTTADRENRRFFNYLEILRHNQEAAWEPRSAHVRAAADVRRDFAFVVANPSEGAFVHVPGSRARGALPFVGDAFVNYAGVMAGLSSAIDEFRRLLNERSQDPEAVFHNFLVANPILLDVYGDLVSKPRLNYPPGQVSPTGKSYLEPDFVIVYPEQKYTLVELERPATGIGTKAGQPGAGLTHAAFQTTEWIDFIAHHPHIVHERFPGLARNYTTMVIMSRSTAEATGHHDPSTYKNFVKNTYKIDDLLFYDDLLWRAEALRASVSALRTDGG